MHVAFQEDVNKKSGFRTASTRDDAPTRETPAEKEGMFKESKQDARIQEQCLISKS